jgi:hypothetical protein
MANAFVNGLLKLMEYISEVLTVITASWDVQCIVALNHDKGLAFSTF